MATTIVHGTPKRGVSYVSPSGTYYSDICAVCGCKLDAQNTHPISDIETAYCTPCAEKRMFPEYLQEFFYYAKIAASEVMAAEKKAAKKASAKAKKQSNLTIIAIARFKSHGAVLIGVEDRNGKEPVTMHVTICNGRVTSCINPVTGLSCSGMKWAGHCCHTDRAMSYEASRKEQFAEAAVIAPVLLGSIAQDVEQHVEDDLRMVVAENFEKFCEAMGQIATELFADPSFPIFIFDGEGTHTYVIRGDDLFCERNLVAQQDFPLHRAGDETDLARVHVMLKAQGKAEAATRRLQAFSKNVANFFEAVASEAASQRRRMAPLNGNAGFSLLKPERAEYAHPRRQQETW